MKKSYLFFVFLILFAASADSQTDAPMIPEPTETAQHETYLFGGAAIPYLPESFRNDWDPSHTIGLGFGYSYEPGEIGYTSVYATFEFNKFRGHSDNTGRVHLVMLNFKGVFSPTRESIAPYFRVGIGYMYFATDSLSAENNGSEVSAFAWSFGVGVEVPVSKSFAGFIEGSSVLGVLEKPKQAFPLLAGIRFRF